MCKPNETKTETTTLDENPQLLQQQSEQKSIHTSISRSMFLRRLRPFVAVVAMIYMFPNKEDYVNRGYTAWFHKLSIFYLLSNIEFLRRFLIVQGIGISLGWYSAAANDLYYHGRFCHILYMNMPDSMKAVMVDQVTGEIFTTTESLIMICISHALDTFLHPGLVYLFWRSHCDYCSHSTSSSEQQQQQQQGKKDPWREAITWPVVISTFMLSRAWSCFHSYYNDGEFKLYYYGFDVYVLKDLDSWFPAYLAEGLFFIAITLYKVFWEPKQQEEGKQSSSSDDSMTRTIKNVDHIRKQKVV